MASDETPEGTPTSGTPTSPGFDILTPRVDALRERLAQDKVASSARKERKKSLEGSGDARSTIEGMLTARRTARKQSVDFATSGPPEWFTTFKQGMEARVSDLENQLDEKTDEVQALRDRVAALEAGTSSSEVVRRDNNAAEEQSFAPIKAPHQAAQGGTVPKLSLGGGGPTPAADAEDKAKGPVADVKKPAPSKLASPKARPGTSGTKTSPKPTAAASAAKKREGGWK